MSDACLNPGSRLLVGKDSVLLVVVLIQSRDHLVSTKSCSCLVLDVCLSLTGVVLSSPVVILVLNSFFSFFPFFLNC